MTNTTVSSGTQTGIVVSSGDTVLVTSSGRTSGTAVNGGIETVQNGGIVFTTSITSGTENVLSGGIASGTVVTSGAGVSAGGVQIVSGGAAVATDIQAGGQDIVLAGATINAAMVEFGGVVFIEAGGQASGAMVIGGTLQVDGGGFASGTSIDGGNLNITAGGSATGVTLTDGAFAMVNGTGGTTPTTISGAIVDASFLQVMSASAYGTVIQNGGFADIADAATFGTTVSSGGEEFVESGSTVSGTHVLNGGSEEIASGATGTDVVVDSGGSLSLDGSLILAPSAGATIREGGAIFGAGAIVKSGGGRAVLAAANTYSGGTTVAAGTLELTNSAGAGDGAILFGGTATLQLDGTTLPTNVISSFTRADTIDLQGVTFAGTDTVSASGDTVTIHAGAQNYMLNVAGASAQGFSLASDGDGSLLVKTDAPCFAAGTRIAVPDGEAPVQALQAGDTVRLARGGTARIVWTGQRRVMCARHPQPERVWPVRISAGAFGDGLPLADLVLSPDHSMFAEGVLIPAKLLVNGTTVTQEHRDAIDYHHIELETHDLVLANGLAAETYLDTGNRAMFADVLHPDFAPRTWPDDGCAELVTRGPVLARVRARLLAEAARRGHRSVRDDTLRVAVGGAMLTPFETEGALRHFWLPAGTMAFTLHSEAGIPWEHDASADDGRTLGVAVERIKLSDGSVSHVVPLDHASLTEGWHTVEGPLRWTDGNGQVSLAGLALKGPVLLTVCIRAEHPFWLRAETSTAREKLAA